MTRSARISGAAALVLVSALAAPGWSSADAAPLARALPATNGPVLLGDQLFNADGSHHQIKVTGTTTMEFSPDGSRIVGVTLGNVIRVWSADGTSKDVATLAQTVKDVTWSSDGTMLAALTGDEGNHPHSIVVLPAAGGAASPVYTDTSDSRINLESGISWQPGGTKVLFTANLPFDPGMANASIVQQLFTVQTSGGSPTQVWVPPAAATDPVFRFGSPEGAPDGSHFAVYVQENGTVPTPYQHDYLSIMSATSPSTPASLRAVNTNPPIFAGPHWSTDGSALLFGDVPAGPGPAPVTVIAAAGGGLLGTYAYGGQFSDWQPCPTGSCVAWGLHAPRSVSLESSKSKVPKGKKVTLAGQIAASGVAMCTAAQPLEVQRGKPGKNAAFKHLANVTTDAAGRFAVKAKVRKTAQYRVVLTGRVDCLAATSAVVKVKAQKRRH